MPEQFKRSTFTFVVTILLVSLFSSATQSVEAQTLPAPWQHADIGSPGVAGSARESSGTFTIDASGTDIWGATDQFHFVYYAVSGDVDIRATVNEIERVHWWTKGGVMIRETLAANSKHAMTVISASSGQAFQRRVTTGGNSVSTERSGRAPGWVRLVRAGNVFTSYVSTDGSNWTQVGTATITMADTVYVGLALTSVDNTQLATASFANLTVQASPWSKRDVGSPAVAGSASEASGTFSVAGAGADIWDPSDQFQYMYQRIDGDVQIVARLANIGNVNPKSKGGVMIREALTGTSSYAYMFGTAGEGWAWRSRAVSNGGSVHMPGSPSASPGWVKVVRQGANFTGYESSDGVNWTLVGSETISMPSTVYVGLAVNSKNVTTTTTGTFTDVSITLPDLPGNLPPTAAITSPAPGSRFTAPATVTVNASAADADGTVAQVQFFANGTSIGTDTTAPFSFSWTNVAAGTYSLTARATDNQGASTTSAPVSITVDPSSNTPPAVSLTAPANNATYTAPAAIAMTASASDSNGTVARVDFYQGSTLLGSDTTSPYAYNWTNVAAGTYTLTARATDNGGATTTSNAVTVTVTAANQAPTAAITSPSNNAAYTAPATIAISASASDSNGTVTRVDFYQGSTLLGSDTTSPYAFTWTNVPAGSYTLTARATDNAGATGTSAAVTVIVNAPANQVPTAAITSPASGATFTAPATIVINANAADSDGTVARVEFYQGTTLLGSDTSAPYSFTWSNVAAGSYSLTARAIDNASGTGTSAAVSVTVNPAPPQATSVAFTPASDHTSNVVSYRVELRRAGDPVTAAPVATRDIGKPAIVNNEITADISSTVNPLPAGSYYAVVVAVNPVGTGSSTPSATFTK